MSTKSLTPNNGDQLNKNTLNSEMGVSSRSSINPSSKNVKKSKGAKQQVEAIEKLSKNVLPRKRVDLDAISKALVIALTAGASVITPAVVYFKRNEEYESRTLHLLFHKMRQDLVEFIEGRHKNLTRLRTLLRADDTGTFKLVHYPSCSCISHAQTTLKI